MSAGDLRQALPSGAYRFFQVLALLSGVTLAAGAYGSSQPAEAFWANLLLASYYLLGLGLGGVLLVALHHVTGARWSVPIRRVPEAMAAVLPAGALGLLIVLFCRPSLYSWSVADAGRGYESLSEKGSDPLDALHKSLFNGANPRGLTPFRTGYESPLHHLWLNWPFFILRSLTYVVAWLALAVVVVRGSRRVDADSDPARIRHNVRTSAAFLVVFGVTCWLASYDWIMSLEPDWASTIFGVYNFAGLFLSALAATILLILMLRRNTLQAVLKVDHLHDLGTLLFGFSSFWMYTWFCQYLLIWFVNNPDETAYYVRRWHGTWPVLLFLDLILNWGIPFIVLLFRSAKRSPLVLGSIAVIVLAGRWVDLFVMILPSQADTVPAPGLIEFGLLLGTVAVFGLACLRGLRARSAVN